MSSSPARPNRAFAPSARKYNPAQSSPADSLFMSTTPLQEQQERALRQVLQEEVTHYLTRPNPSLS